MNNYESDTRTTAAEILKGEQDAIAELMTDALVKDVEDITIGEMLEWLSLNRENYQYFIV